MYKKDSTLYIFDNEIKKQNARLKTWEKHKQYTSELTGTTQYISEYKSIQNAFRMLLNVNPELKQFVKFDENNNVVSISRSKKSLQEFSKSSMLNWYMIKNSKTWKQVYNDVRNKLKKENKNAKVSKEDIINYITDSTDIEIALNSMSVIYAMKKEGNTTASEILDIIRGTEKGGKRKLTDTGVYEKVSENEWKIVREKLGIIKNDSRFRKAIEKGNKR